MDCNEVTAPPSNPDRFWEIIDQTVSTGSGDEQIAALKELLSELSDEDLIWFAGDYQRAQNALDVRMLSIAADLAIYWCSDDGQVYFRSWVISKGREAYEALRANPDNLASFLPKPEDRDSFNLEFEEFAYVAGDVWRERNGEMMPFVNASADPWEKGSDLGAGEVYAALRADDLEPGLKSTIDISREMGMFWYQIRDNIGYPKAYEPNMLDVPLDDIPRLLPRMYAWGQAAFGLTLDEFREDPLAQQAG